MGSFDDLMSAVTFAEEGESGKAREILGGKKTVLLAISDRLLDKNALKYALSICSRLRANLEILYVTETDRAKTRLKEFLSEFGSFSAELNCVVKGGCVKKAILDHTNEKRAIEFVVIGSTPELETGCRADKRLSSEWEKLRCPLVVVSKGPLPEGV
ncbi:MAG: hypothetical protein Q8J64_03860 [Thermodesulfovibrionales bacterium]|nr:hypothetical protein [Thermodesulfovibrionales bacterium]